MFMSFPGLSKSSDASQTRDFKLRHKFQPKLFSRLHNTFISINKIKIPFRAGALGTSTTGINEAFHNPIGLLQVPAPLQPVSSHQEPLSNLSGTAGSTSIRNPFADTSNVNNSSISKNNTATGDNGTDDDQQRDGVVTTSAGRLTNTVLGDGIDDTANLNQVVASAAATALHNVSGGAGAVTSSNANDNPIRDFISPTDGGFNQPFGLSGYTRQPVKVIQHTGGFELGIGGLVHLKKHRYKVFAYSGGR